MARRTVPVSSTAPPTAAATAAGSPFAERSRGGSPRCAAAMARVRASPYAERHERHSQPGVFRRSASWAARQPAPSRAMRRSTALTRPRARGGARRTAVSTAAWGGVSRKASCAAPEAQRPARRRHAPGERGFEAASDEIVDLAESAQRRHRQKPREGAVAFGKASSASSGSKARPAVSTPSVQRSARRRDARPGAPLAFILRRNIDSGDRTPVPRSPEAKDGARLAAKGRDGGGVARRGRALARGRRRVRRRRADDGLSP